MRRPGARAYRPKLRTGVHTILQLAPDLLLVFKPAGHREPPHAHAHRQRLRLVRGRLVVTIGARRIVLDAKRTALTLPAGRVHGTRADVATWVVAETLGDTRDVAGVPGRALPRLRRNQQSHHT